MEVEQGGINPKHRMLVGDQGKFKDVGRRKRRVEKKKDRESSLGRICKIAGSSTMWADGGVTACGGLT